MGPFTKHMAKILGVVDGTDVLVRTGVPKNSVKAGGRDRHSAPDHEDSIAVDLKHPALSGLRTVTPLIIDKAIYDGATLEGTRRAMVRDLGSRLQDPVALKLYAAGPYLKLIDPSS